MVEYVILGVLLVLVLVFVIIYRLNVLLTQSI